MATTLSDISEFIIDTKHNTPKYTEHGYPCIRTPNIGRGYFILENVKYVNEKTYQNWTERAEPKTGDLILAREAPVGNVSYIPPGLKPCIGQRTVLIRPKKDHVDSRYLNYLLLGDECQNHMHSMSGGATVAHLNMSDIRNMILPDLPPLPTQRKIAAILSSYDNLIENNLRRIKILEEMAQNLYREWFIHFRYPIHFRDTGSEPSPRPEGHPSPTGRRDGDEGRAKLVDSPLGRISVGWNVVNFGELYITSSGGTPSRKVAEYYGGAHPWIKTRELNDGFILETEETITDLGLIKSSAKLFPENTVILAIYGATIGKLGILSMPSATNQACVAILQKEVGFGRAFAFLFLLENRDKLIGLGQGAAQQNISQVVLKNFPAFRPPVSLMQAFSVMVEPLLDNVRNLQHKNTTLRRTRDLMLPKLISGEVDVSELDIAIPEEDNKV